MTDQHTPGPWGYSFESVDPEWAIVTTSGGSVIANVNDLHTQKANARLIAASPELLAFAECLVSAMDAPPKLRKALIEARLPNARLVVAKARGVTE